MQDKAKQAPLLTRIGGTDAVDTLVGALYFNILNDPRLSRFFEHVPVSRVLDHQRRFLTLALDGGLKDDGSNRWLTEAHRDLVKTQGLGHRHFDAVIENLELTLQDLEVPEGEAHEVVALLGATRNLILGA